MEELQHLSFSNHHTESPKAPLPQATAILILGILSIFFSFWYFSIIGVIFSIIALVMGNHNHILYRHHPEKYTLKSYHNLRAGRICAIIGLVLAILFFTLMMLLIFGILISIPFLGMID